MVNVGKLLALTEVYPPYVQDFEEYSLRLAYPEPTNVIGRTAFGNGKICSIPGQSPTKYIAVDCGSEMPAYEVYRNTNSPPFDWRHATFQSMEFTGVIGTQSHKRTTDPALIADLVRTLTPEALARIAKEYEMTVEELQKDADFEPYFTIKLVLIEDAGQLKVGYFEFLSPSMLD